jgi:Bacterial regulatory protein, Fis family
MVMSLKRDPFLVRCPASFMRRATVFLRRCCRKRSWIRLRIAELHSAVDRLQSLINNTQDISVLRRLARSLCRGFLFLYEHPGLPPSFDWTNFCFKSAVLDYEAHIIKLALQEAQGRRKQAAELLGLKSRQGLTALLKGRHKALADYPTPAPQRRSIIRNDDNRVGAPKRTDDE